MTDTYIEQLLQENSLRPLAGHLFCEKIISDGEYHNVNGSIVQGELLKSGILVPQAKTTESLNYLATSYIVRVVGQNVPWFFRFFDKERNYNTTFKEQNIEVGTVIAARSVAGVNQARTSKFVDIRYDEICVIAANKEDSIDFYPAPGWVIIEPLSAPERSIHLVSSFNSVATFGHVVRGKVYSLPKSIPSDLIVGDIVYAPAHSGSGATEWIELGNYRAVPLDDILGIEE